MSQSKTERLLQMGLRTVRGEAREGFFIPYRHAAAVPERVDAYRALALRFRAARDSFETVLRNVETLAADLRAIDGSGREHARWDQYWYPRMDAAAAYTLIRVLKPARVVEIGSGHSTRFIWRAAVDGGLNCAVTAIDPEPRATLASLPIDLERRTLQAVDLSLFSNLEAGDFLFVDSSHILMPGSDVDIVLNRILPFLAPGVVVSFHDVFLPFAYPDDWAWRGYNEQNAVGALLQGGYELVFASHYAVREMTDIWRGGAIDDLPVPVGAHECGIWLRKM